MKSNQIGIKYPVTSPRQTRHFAFLVILLSCRDLFPSVSVSCLCISQSVFNQPAGEDAALQLHPPGEMSATGRAHLRAQRRGRPALRPGVWSGKYVCGPHSHTGGIYTHTQKIEPRSPIFLFFRLL